jgi:hypothetical protein
MVKVIYAVLRQKGVWKIKQQDKFVGPYGSQQEAIDQAIKAAYKAGLKGYDAEVHIQGGDKKFRPEWIYGQSPDPVDPAKT